MGKSKNAEYFYIVSVQKEKENPTMHYVEVKYQPEQSKSYIGSPSLVRLPDGALVASHDYFGALRTLEGENGLTSIYRSEVSIRCD